MSGNQWKVWFDWRKTLLIAIVLLGVATLGDRWKQTLDVSLADTCRELAESLSLLDSNLEIQEKELESFQALKASQVQNENWVDSIAPLIAEQQLILRQQRPLGIEQLGKNKEEKLFLQVEGSVESLLGFLHYIATQESPIYVSRCLMTSRLIGTGLVSVELVLTRVVL